METKGGSDVGAAVQITSATRAHFDCQGGAGSWLPGRVWHVFRHWAGGLDTGRNELGNPFSAVNIEKRQCTSTAKGATDKTMSVVKIIFL